MNIEDLRLLVEVAYRERNGQCGVTIEHGFGRARDRLVESGLLVLEPTVKKEYAMVMLTAEGEERIRRMLKGS